MPKAPYRVGAILSSNKEEVHFLGYGEYVGDEVPPADTADPESFQQLLHENSIANPKIVLDNGNVVWGCQCWWGPEEKVKTNISDGRKIIEAVIS